MFLEDQEGLAHLCRWYHSIIKATPDVWAEMGGGQETYSASTVLLPPLESPTLELLPQDGLLSCCWQPFHDHPRALDWLLTFSADSVVVTAGNWVAELCTTVDDNVLRVGWPTWAGLNLSFPRNTRGTHLLRIRPRSFDIRRLIDHIHTNHLQELQTVGLLSHWHSVPWSWQKIAIAWLACQRLPVTEIRKFTRNDTPTSGEPVPPFIPIIPDPGMMFVYTAEGQMIMDSENRPIQVLIS